MDSVSPMKSRVLPLQLPVAVLLVAFVLGASAASAAADPYLWLEEIKSEEVDAWVDGQNAATVARLSGDPRFEALKSQFKAILESDDRLPEFSEQVQYRGQVYELHTDALHPRGKIVRTSLESYASGAALWETLVDVDEIAAKEGRNW